MVKIYSTQTCPYCEMAKEYLESHNVSYESFDVSNDEKAQEEMLKKSHQMGVPVLDIDGMIIVGFNRAQIDKALNLK